MLVHRTPRPVIVECAERAAPRVPWGLLALAALLLLLLAALPPPAQAQGAELATLAAGAAVRAGDGDAVPVLMSGSGLAAVCVPVNASAYQPGDRVYFHAGACSERVMAGDLRLQGPGFGTKVQAGEPDDGLPLRLPPATPSLGFVDRDGDGRWSTGDAAYLKLVGDAALLAAGDVRLAGAGLAPGSPIRAGDPDVGLGLHTGGRFAARPGFDWQAWDADGNFLFDGRDALYVDLDSDDRPSVLDLRLTPPPGRDVGAGVVLDRTDLEVVPILQPPNAASLCFTDDNGDGLFSLDEHAFFHRAGTCGPLLAGDVRLSAPGFGEALGPEAAETGRPSTDIGGGADYLDEDSNGAWSTGDTLYLSRAPGSPVALGALRLTPHGARGAGTPVAPGDADLNQATSTIGVGVVANTDWQFWDASGDARLGGEDVLYIDVDGDDRVTAGDVRISPLGGVAGGQAVGIGAPDLRAFLEPSTNADVCYHDQDGDLTYSAGDPLTVRLGSCGDGVHAGDVRLTGADFGAKVRATDTDARATWVGLLVRVAFLDQDRNGLWTAGDAAYLQATRTGTFPLTISASDVRLTAYGSRGPGTVVASGDEDLGATALTPQSFHAALGRDWRAWDVDGDGFFGGDDGLYIDLDADGQAGVLDLRLTPVRVPAPGSPRFALQVAVSPAAAMVDEPVTITVTASNNGTLPSQARVVTCVDSACFDDRVVTVPAAGALSWDLTRTFRAAGSYVARASGSGVEAASAFNVGDAAPLVGTLSTRPAGKVEVGEEVSLEAALTSRVGNELVAGTFRVCDDGACDEGGFFGVIGQQTVRRTLAFDRAGTHHLQARFEFSGRYEDRPPLVLQAQVEVATAPAPPVPPTPPPAPSQAAFSASLDPRSPARGQPAQLTVTVRNAGTQPWTAGQYQVKVCSLEPGRSDTCARTERLEPLPALAPGASTTQRTGIRFDQAGDQDLRLTLEGTPAASASLVLSVSVKAPTPGHGPLALLAALGAVALLARRRAR